MKRILVLLLCLVLPSIALAPPKICDRFQRKCQKQYQNPSGAFLRSLITQEMRDCLDNPLCEMRGQVLNSMTYNEVVVEDLRNMSIVLSNAIRQKENR